MADVKFTEGPWVAREREPRSDWWTVEGKDTVCDLYHLDEATHERIRYEELCTEANARLIAASPDLYEALKGLLSKYEEMCRSFDCPAANAARAALTKAEGQS